MGRKRGNRRSKRCVGPCVIGEGEREKEKEREREREVPPFPPFFFLSRNLYQVTIN